MERFDHAEARRWIARAQEAVPDPGWPWVAPLLAILQSRLLRLRHEFDAADEALRPHLEDSALPRWIRTEVVTEAVHVRLSTGSPEAGLRLLDGARDEPWAAVLRATAAVIGGHSPSGLPEGHAGLSRALAVETEILRSCASLGASGGAAAVDALDRALGMAAED